MTKLLYAICTWAGAALLGFGSLTPAPFIPVAGKEPGIPDLDGTYELEKRVTSDGKEIVSPTIGGLYSLAHGRGNFNLFWVNKDHTLVSESTITRYTLTGSEYCEWIVFTLRNNIDQPGVSNEAPAVKNHCSPVTLREGRIVFEPPGEGVVMSVGKDGFTATAAGEFIDHW